MLLAIYVAALMLECHCKSIWTVAASDSRNSFAYTAISWFHFPSVAYDDI